MGFKDLGAPRKTGNRWRLFLSEAGVLVWVCVRARARVRVEGWSRQAYEIPMGFKGLGAPRKFGNRWRLFLSGAGGMVRVWVRARARARVCARLLPRLLLRTLRG